VQGAHAREPTLDAGLDIRLVRREQTLPCQAGGQAAMARSRMEREPSGTMVASVASKMRPWPWQRGQAPCGVLGEKSSANSMGAPRG